jgi:hypothetical protein
VTEGLVIERRFRGPPDSANGGYACGVVAAAIEPAPAVEVTLRAPPPLDSELQLVAVDGGAELRDGETLVASGAAAPAPELDVPAPVTIADAESARRDAPFRKSHPFPACFVCGPEPEDGDGLHVTAGPVPGRETELVAAPFETEEAMANGGAGVRPELLWSVLDCPGGIAAMALVPGVRTAVLGRMAARMLSPVPAGEAHVAIGWPIDRDGRKIHVGSAILDAHGEALAVARATWIEIPGDAP